MLLGHKISARVAEMRTLPEGIDQRSACRHPDWTGPDDLAIKITELREITGWRKPVYVKVGAARPLLRHRPGSEGGCRRGGAGTACRVAPPPPRTCSSSTWGIPTLAAVPEAVRALKEMQVHRTACQLIAAGGSRSGADVAKALGAGGRRCVHRYSRPHRHRRQQPRPRQRVPPPGLRCRASGRTSTPAPTRRASPPRIPNCRAASTRACRATPRQLPTGAHPGGTDPGPGVRQVPRAEPRTRGPRRPHRRGRRHGQRPPRWHRLDPRPPQPLSHSTPRTDAGKLTAAPMGHIGSTERLR